MRMNLLSFRYIIIHKKVINVIRFEIKCERDECRFAVLSRNMNSMTFSKSIIYKMFDKRNIMVPDILCKMNNAWKSNICPT